MTWKEIRDPDTAHSRDARAAMREIIAKGSAFAKRGETLAQAVARHSWEVADAMAEERERREEES